MWSRSNSAPLSPSPQPHAGTADVAAMAEASPLTGRKPPLTSTPHTSSTSCSTQSIWLSPIGTRSLSFAKAQTQYPILESKTKPRPMPKTNIIVTAPTSRHSEPVGAEPLGTSNRLASQSRHTPKLCQVRKGLSGEASFVSRQSVPLLAIIFQQASFSYKNIMI
ncbi:hypothetical protein LX32DRAFT_131862 [Colletotrichum zoysiae]|uniref:Uncharacterized protein n=1 Tax=Colletotrichum zoysiae TaxID=1216348 RepID=A0AAD9H8W8_9PEZI|nr:hypothetical protein LX32DRAFT_131862 [Colletotrichum zoysiae]